MRRSGPLLALLLCTAAIARAADPTAQELHFLYELNRARHDPAGWAAEYGLGTRTGGDGQPATLANVDPAPPLAWNPALTDAARFKAQEIATHDYAGHQSTVGPTFYWPNELVRSFGYPLAPFVSDGAGGYFFFGDDTNSIESLGRGYGPGAQDFSKALNVLTALIVDAGGLGHRDHLLAMSPINRAFVEIGAGYASNPSGLYRNYWAIHTGVRGGGELFLTGVAFADANANERFDPGEGLAGVTVQAGTASTQTGATGGYALLVADGGYDVACSGGGFAGNAAGHVATSDRNHQLDCVSGEPTAWLDFAPAPEPSPLGALLAAFGAIAALARRPSS